MPTFAIDESRLVRDLETLAQWGRAPDGAMTRLALSHEDAQARMWVRDRMRALELEVTADEVGNLLGRRRGKRAGAPVVMTGSHLDSVPAGGRFDGPYGIVAPLEVVRAWNAAKVSTERDLYVCVFVGEEGSRFRRGTLGSAAKSGYLAVGDIHALVDAAGVRFKDALATYGSDPPCTAPARLPEGGLHAFVELHIEQGGVLEHAKLPIGVVDAIAGLRQFTVRFTGDANHAGATPMALRRDALAAAAELIAAVEFGATSVGGGAVGTVGKCELAPDAALNIIPGQCLLGIDLRAPAPALLDELEEQMREIAERAGKKRRVEVAIDVRQKVAPGAMHARCVGALGAAAEACGLRHLRMPSGAIHDALHMAEAGPAGMLFVPSAGGKSHCKEEQTQPADLARGTLVLAHALHILAQQ
jgi:hydantoinase/carbamoylase family amidase